MQVPSSLALLCLTEALWGMCESGNRSYLLNYIMWNSIHAWQLQFHSYNHWTIILGVFSDRNGNWNTRPSSHETWVLKIFNKIIFIGEKSAKGSRKVRERLAKGESARIPPWPKMV
jgi:hypothetical protein